jgi:hypothetical protein
MKVLMEITTPGEFREHHHAFHGDLIYAPGGPYRAVGVPVPEPYQASDPQVDWLVLNRFEGTPRQHGNQPRAPR